MANLWDRSKKIIPFEVGAVSLQKWPKIQTRSAGLLRKKRILPSALKRACTSSLAWTGLKATADEHSTLIRTNYFKAEEVPKCILSCKWLKLRSSGFRMIRITRIQGPDLFWLKFWFYKISLGMQADVSLVHQKRSDESRNFLYFVVLDSDFCS